MSDKADTSRAQLEKPELDVCFIPIVCSAPLIYAHSHGFFEENGLSVNLRSAPGWSGIKELLVYGMADAVHMLSPMPLACSLGIDGKQTDLRLALVQNVNGQALTLSTRHAGLKRVEEMRGFTFGVPYRFSMHYYLLCHYLAQHGLNPLQDVTIMEVSPPRMPYYLEQGWVDGVFAPEPFNQLPVNRGTGYIHLLSRELWDGHPCCCLATRQSFIDQCPNTYQALVRSVAQASLALQDAGLQQLKSIAQEISDSQHLKQEDSLPVEQVLTGHFPDGKGGQHKIPDRIRFAPHPWGEYGHWILTQMQRWGQLSGTVDYEKVVGEVFRTSETCDITAEIGYPSSEPAPINGISLSGNQEALQYLQQQPFSAHHIQVSPGVDYELPDQARQRLMEVVSHMAEVAGGRTDLELKITGRDEVGLLEQMLNEVVLNMKFAGEALVEERDRLDQRVLERTRRLSQEIEVRKQAEEHVARQAQEILALSTPVIQIWEGILVAPIIGTLDTSRAQQFAERLLEAIMVSRSEVVLVDITGVPMADTQTAQSLLETAAAVKLLGAHIILTGIRPALAQTLVSLSIDMSDVITRSSLAAGLEEALAIRKGSRQL